MSCSFIPIVSVAGNDPLISFTLVLEGPSAVLAIALLLVALVSAAAVFAKPAAI